MKPAVIREAKARGDRAGFSRVDLLAVVVAIGILVVALLPALARTHVEPQGTQCLFNLRQIITGWMMFASDNNGKVTPNRSLFPPNPDYNTPPAGVSNRARWVGGSMRGLSVGAPYTGIDATNIALLTDPTFTSLAPYVRNPVLYRCPTDLSTWGGVPRVRSYSMNAAIGTAFNGTHQDPGHTQLGEWLAGMGAMGPGPWRTYIQESDMVAPTPSQLYVLLDEHPNSINDGAFAFEMPVGWAQTYFIDMPAKYHDNACNFAFADGHVESHLWRDPRVIPPEVWAADTAPAIGSMLYSVPNDPDVLWMAHRTTAPLPGKLVYYPGP